MNRSTVCVLLHRVLPLLHNTDNWHACMRHAHRAVVHRGAQMRWHIACTFCSVDISAYVCAHARLFFEILREEHVQVLHMASSWLTLTWAAEQGTMVQARFCGNGSAAFFRFLHDVRRTRGAPIACFWVEENRMTFCALEGRSKCKFCKYRRVGCLVLAKQDTMVQARFCGNGSADFFRFLRGVRRT